MALSKASIHGVLSPTFSSPGAGRCGSRLCACHLKQGREGCEIPFGLSDGGHLSWVPLWPSVSGLSLTARGFVPGRAALRLQCRLTKTKGMSCVNQGSAYSGTGL
ncbi:hypothetical protein ACOMHN_006167 [Nucella lapillus]